MGHRIKVVVGYDSTDDGFLPTAVVYDENDQPVEVTVEVRDYGQGSEVDADGNLYLDVTP